MKAVWKKETVKVTTLSTITKNEGNGRFYFVGKCPQYVDKATMKLKAGEQVVVGSENEFEVIAMRDALNEIIEEHKYCLIERNVKHYIEDEDTELED